MAYRKGSLLAAGFILWVLSACDPLIIPPTAKLDTPDHHVSNGMRLLQMEKIEAATREFNRAKELDSAYSPAYVGLGLVKGFRGNYQGGLDAMKKADESAITDEQRVSVMIGFMQLYTMAAEQLNRDWLKRVEDLFHRATATAPDFPDSYYYMGVAYRVCDRLEDAGEMFARVVEIGRAYAEEASREISILRDRNPKPSE